MSKFENRNEKAVKSGKLSHLIKNIKEGKPANARDQLIGMVRRRETSWRRWTKPKIHEEAWMQRNITFHLF
jgi:hypothetical protein